VHAALVRLTIDPEQAPAAAEALMSEAFALIERKMPPPAPDCAGGREWAAVQVAESRASRGPKL